MVDLARARRGSTRRRAAARLRDARRALGLALVASPLALGAIGAHFLVAHAPARLSRDVATPVVVVTEWGAEGAAAFTLLAAAVALTALLLGFAVVRIRRRPRAIDRPAIATGAVIGLLGAAAWPFIFSSDIYAYAAYGDLAARGFDPYRLAPATVRDATLDAARLQWRGPFPVDIYGPGMLAISRIAVETGRPWGLGATLAALRLGAATAFLGSVALLDLALGGSDPRRRTTVLAAYALNPVVLWAVAEGHNDAFVALGLSAVAALARAGGPRVGGIVAGLLPILKATGAGFALGYALETIRRRRSDWRATLAATALGLALATVLTLPSLVTALLVVRSHGRYAPALSVQGLLGLGPALALAIGALGWGLRRMVAGDARGYAWLGIAAILALPNDYPWYALWLVPCALAAGGGAAAVALWLATIVALVRYLPDAVGPLSREAAEIAAAVAILPLALAFAEFAPTDRREKDSPPT